LPGLFGFTFKKGDKQSLRSIGETMKSLMTYKKSYVCDDILLDNYVCAGRVHPNVIQKEKQPLCINNNSYLWLDGELYDTERYSLEHSAGGIKDPEILANQYIKNYQHNSDWKFLSDIEGAYSVVIWDRDRRQIHLISDRYSTVLLFWTYTQGVFIWGTELKIFTAHPNFQIQIDRDAVDEFINLGMMIGDKTYFKNVYRIPAASVITYTIDSHIVSTKKYWWWDQISTLSSAIAPVEICDELGERFKKSVKDRLRTEEKIELSLSGGVDSRAILAALPERQPPVIAYTFGRPDSEDVIIAKKYARLKGIQHKVTNLTIDNWLQGRIKCIWWMDGLFDMQHMHGASGNESTEDSGGIALVGLFAEVLKGRAWFVDMDKIDQFIYSKQKAGYIGNSDKVVSRYVDYIRSVGSSHVYTMDSYIKNFSTYGLRLGIVDGSQIRTPFSAYNVLDFVYSIPSEMMRTPDIYHGMLLLKFPQYFRGIHCRLLDVPTENMHKITYTYNRISNGIRLRAKRCGIIKPRSKHLAAYSDWLRTGIGYIAYNKILNNKNALYKEYVHDVSISKYFDEHMSGTDKTQFLSRCFTFEVWLQQLINNKYRDYINETDFQNIKLIQ
jgi:asparagine synthase (glutamine-hydrolysing)